MFTLLLSWCLMSSDVIWHIRDKLWPMPKHGSIRKVYACLAVTCHLHIWQNDRDFLRATVVTRGWNGYRNKSQHRKSTLEKKILPPFQQGFEPATFQSRVRRSNHWAIPAPACLRGCSDADVASKVLLSVPKPFGGRWQHQWTAAAEIKIECPFSGVTSFGRVWRKVKDSNARSVSRSATTSTWSSRAQCRRSA